MEKGRRTTLENICTDTMEEVVSFEFYVDLVNHQIFIAYLGKIIYIIKDLPTKYSYRIGCMTHQEKWIQLEFPSKANFLKWSTETHKNFPDSTMERIFALLLCFKRYKQQEKNTFPKPIQLIIIEFLTL